jgi:hypothetical protein
MLSSTKTVGSSIGFMATADFFRLPKGNEEDVFIPMRSEKKNADRAARRCSSLLLSRFA